MYTKETNSLCQKVDYYCNRHEVLYVINIIIVIIIINHIQ